jgi:hypothetical protein
MEPITVFIVFMLGAVVGILLGSRLSRQKAANEPELLLPEPQVLNVQDGSIVVLRVPGAISTESAKRLKEYWESSAAAAGTKCIVLGDGMSINCVLDPSKP